MFIIVFAGLSAAMLFVFAAGPAARARANAPTAGPDGVLAPNNTFTVDTFADDAGAHDTNPGDGVCSDSFGSCTLRAAIEEANANSGLDTINFASAMTITINGTVGALPAITDDLEIDASSVWNSTDGRPGVVLSGNGQNMSGLDLRSGIVKVYGLHITGFKYYGIDIFSGGNWIGGTGTGQSNVISGNGDASGGGGGIRLGGSAATSNRIWNNLIGVAPARNAAQPNSVGIYIAEGAADNDIGGSTASYGNVIAGNTEYGVYLWNTGNDNAFGGNIIGGFPVGPGVVLNNGKDGIYISSSGNVLIGGRNTNTGEIWAANQISYNNFSGVYITSNSPVVMKQNSLTNNGNNGISIWTGSHEVISNTLSNNTQNGIYIDNATGNLLSQNSIYSNGSAGIRLWNGGNTELAAPVIDTLTPSGASGTTCSGCIVELYSDSGNQGKTYEGRVTANVSGDWAYSGAFTGPNVTAITIDSSNNTSEFSSPQAVPTNQPPYTPSSPSPVDNAIGVGLNTPLTWIGGDPDGDTVSYQVWGGEFTWVTSTLWYSGTATTTANLSNLKPNTQYTWQVWANDGTNATVMGPVWTFTTDQMSYSLYLPIVLRP